MDNPTIELLETLEEKIENIKWLITTPFSLNKTGVSAVIGAIRKSAGILGKSFPKGITFENKARRKWKGNFLKRAT